MLAYERSALSFILHVLKQNVKERKKDKNIEYFLLALVIIVDTYITQVITQKALFFVFFCNCAL